MVAKVLIAFTLMATCVVVHAVGVTYALRWARPRADWRRPFLARLVLFVRLAVWIILCHLVEITVWAVFYEWKGAIPDLHSALYFSAVTYTTTGYGDLVLPEAWRLVGGVEALTGILMCGWSTGFFFAVVSRMDDAPQLPARSGR
jgi:voltage-gated potassium channel Kch